MFVVGVDGCRDGWVIVALENGAFAGASQLTTFADVLGACEGADAVGVDMPIGFVETGERTCDRLVREFIGPRRASVFIAPPRKALEKATFDEANTECRKRAGFGLTKQFWNLKPKILEVEQALRQGATSHRGEFVHHGRHADDPAALRKFARLVVPKAAHGAPSKLPAGRIVEVHPEASFRELAGTPLVASKKTYDGSMLRLQLLEDAGIVLPKELAIGRVAIDDVLDAAAAAWTTNRYAEGRARSLPETSAWQRERERVLAVWV